MCAPVAIPLGKFLDQRDVIGAEIRKQVFDAEVRQAFEKVVRGALARHL